MSALFTQRPRAPRPFGVYCACTRDPKPMSAVAFDTLKFAQNLRDKANFSPAQAEGVSQAFSEAITDQLATRGDLADLATKADMAALSAATKADIAALSAATKADIAALSAATKDDIAALSAATKDDIADVRKEMGAFRLQ